VQSSHDDWLETRPSLPHGIPSDDTFRRVFNALDPRKFEEAFRPQWISELANRVAGDIIAIESTY